MYLIKFESKQLQATILIAFSNLVKQVLFSIQKKTINLSDKLNGFERLERLEITILKSNLDESKSNKQFVSYDPVSCDYLQLRNCKNLRFWDWQLGIDTWSPDEKKTFRVTRVTRNELKVLDKKFKLRKYY